ncbi:hypothetical protein MMC09_000665 [Bachmanniomyces sp. S44760]|nr:hypothetical protein [Bachmanniomyces sp. S44760]
MAPRKKEAPHGEREVPLPEGKNSLMVPDKTPAHAELIKKRRLGQTKLEVKAHQVGTSNATNPGNLGMFDYAHLRCPLPNDLKSSEIFAPQPKSPHPESYFLMRRSVDGYISATGMFKASFPWAKVAEEKAEREYVQKIPATSQDEVAGNVWIPEALALELAEEYGIVPWVVALLDPEPVTAVADDKKSISPPPKFNFNMSELIAFPQPSATPSGRGRGRPRAGSPAKGGATPGGKAAGSPRKARAKKEPKESSASNAATARAASESLQSALESAASAADGESVDGERVKVIVDNEVEINGDTETTHTTVKIDMPAGSSELPMPEDTEAMIATAKEMVEEARKIEGESSNKTAKAKRKAEVLDDEDEEIAEDETQPAKRQKLLEQKLKKERVRTRALLGIAATLAVGAIIPYII